MISAPFTGHASRTYIMTLAMTTLDGLIATVPEKNLRAYSLFNILEVGIREVIIRAIEDTSGPRAWKSYLPADVFPTFQKAREYERSIKWSNLISHHPLYYTEFPDLSKVIERTSNWNGTFKFLFQRKDVFLGVLRAVEPSRNKIAHNRLVTDEDIALLEAAVSQLASLIGPSVLIELITHPTVSAPLSRVFSSMLTEVETAARSLRALEPLPDTSTWATAHISWWYDETYIGHNLQPVDSYYEFLHDYASLPRSRGSGYLIENFIKSSNWDSLYSQAQACISTIMSQLRG